eukprot:scaffold261108_cov26-Prasinocladus_malaysianus.AAC.2
MFAVACQCMAMRVAHCCRRIGLGENQGLEQQRLVWEGQLEQMSEYMSRVADQAGGAAAASEAMEDQRQALLGQLAELQQAFQQANAARAHTERFATNEIIGQR